MIDSERYYKYSTLYDLAYHDDVNGNCDGKIDITVIDSISGADVAPVVRTEWVSIPSPVLTFRCGNIDCARKIPFGCLPDELKFCPFCGAHMVKRGNE